ncbi:hypothetical protein [Erythrobacter fulvus]|nr:hypothetical protein [Erythrobacter fulvus]
MHDDLASKYDSVFELLSNFNAAEPIPIGMLGKVYSTLDTMRSRRAPSQDIATIEQISVAIRRLEMARRNRDDATERSLGERLELLVSDWLEMHPPGFEQMAEAAE